MRYLSVCSGIEAATVAWHPLGFTPAGFAEIEAFPSAVLAHHYGSNLPGEPLASNGVPNFGDITRFKEWPDAAFDVLVGGTPCQSFSVAGLRKGMADPRGNLALVYLAIADRYRPEWLVWENVPGVLSSSDGRDFGAFLGGLGELGYGFAYRVLDAQYVRVDGFGRAVPQRRRRVFVVGNSRDWRRAAAVLLEPESLSGNSPPRREAREGTARAVAPSLTSGGRSDNPADSRGQDPVVAVPPISHCLNAGGMGRQDYETETVIATAPFAFKASHYTRDKDGAPSDIAPPLSADADKGDQDPLVLAPAVAKTLTRGAESAGKGGYAGRRQEDDDNLIAFDCKAGANTGFAIGELPGALRGAGHGGGHAAVAFTQNSRSEVREIGGDGGVVGALAADAGAQQQNYVATHDVAGTMMSYSKSGGDSNRIDNAASGYMAVSTAGWAVRRLTPRECERLQGFPDDYTLIPHRGKSAADGPRYKALGNSMAVNCMRWIGTRIAMVDAMAKELAA